MFLNHFCLFLVFLFSDISAIILTLSSSEVTGFICQHIWLGETVARKKNITEACKVKLNSLPRYLDHWLENIYIQLPKHSNFHCAPFETQKLSLIFVQCTVEGIQPVIIKKVLTYILKIFNLDSRSVGVRV